VYLIVFGAQVDPATANVLTLQLDNGQALLRASPQRCAGLIQLSVR
jgi:hypothetical protein